MRARVRGGLSLAPAPGPADCADCSDADDAALARIRARDPNRSRVVVTVASLAALDASSLADERPRGGDDAPSCDHRRTRARAGH